VTSDSGTSTLHHDQHPPPRVRPGEPIVCVRELSAGYANAMAFEAVSFDVAAGNLVALIGPNGSGKSTLIKALVGLLQPWSGAIELWGRDPDAVRERIGYMPQAESVDWRFPVTVRQVVEMGHYRPRWGLERMRRLLRPLTPAQDETVEAALDRLGIADLAGTQVAELSGGQQRRVLLARTIVKDPDLLLLDEPAAGLDASAEEDLLGLLLQLASEGKTLIVATHDITSVFEHYPLTICLNGRLVVEGPSSEVLTEDVLVETFGRHLMVFHRGEHGYTVEPHVWHGEHDH
jgi:ABC-type Mn2+/Zn2+ transport system ATPase subunit